ncbi:putative dimethyl sulfoxide reductase chain YnfF precursor [Rubripirellula tenax]|uniref:Putative dimethyl sulfoxide reductase chain YnfF n=1 Tax=Rubripirellula tenax TaxID=2528015 RepID=A0A5C6F4A8_9BACT|nr:molybdopterin-dependent oxidoreductase [Rubripirellula tenax]TWU54866.1 putative dimethyl sulfoxide reductase chain YnfF precursor [Rubripirellula tenax]
MTLESEPVHQSSTTTCPLDCPDACKLVVTVQDNRVVKIDGAKDDPYTDGYICGKVRKYANHVYSDLRLRTPLRRNGPKGHGQFTPISWDEAFSEIVDRIKQDRSRFGAESILPLCYGGSNGKLTQDALDARFFYRLGASRLARTVCAAPSGAAYDALYGKMPGVSCLDYDDSNLIVIWGNNPHASGIHQVPHIQNAQRRGAKLVVVDPKETQLASTADLHLPIFPGSDLVVALAMIRWLNQAGFVDGEFIQQHTNGFEQLLGRADEWTVSRAASVARVPESSLEEFFQWYGESDPAVIRCGWGPERNRNGGSATAAILAIPAVANKFKRSGGFTMSNSAAWRLNQHSVINATPPPTRRINMNLIGETLLHADNPPISTLFVYNCNPVATLPEQNKVLSGLQREDLFTVVFDQVLTDTAVYADIVLPATTFLEHHDLRSGYGNTRLGTISPAIDPIGQSKSNNEVFAELLDRLELSQPGDVTRDNELLEALLGPQAHQQIQQSAELMPDIGCRPIQMEDVFPATPSGKIELFPESLQRESRAGLYRYIDDQPNGTQYPLALISPATRQLVNSSLGYLIEKQAVVTMHASDAAKRNICDGQSVRIFNASGEVIVDAHVTESIAPGVVSLPKGIWMRHSKNHRTSNALSPDTLSDIGAGACFNDARVEISLTSENQNQ